MNIVALPSFTLIGLALPGKTTNDNNQASIDCGGLWEKFLTEEYQQKIPGKITEDVYAVYHSYDGDFTKPYSYFIGCKVQPGTMVPEGLQRLEIIVGNYQPFIAKGQMPGCIVDTWKTIWNSNINRAYKTDFEVYNEKSKDWNDAEIAVFIGVTG